MPQDGTQKLQYRDRIDTELITKDNACKIRAGEYCTSVLHIYTIWGTTKYDNTGVQ